MQTTTSRSRLSRRNFLKVVVAAGATAIAGSALSFYAPWLDYGQAARHTGESFATAADGPARMRELVRYATLAANGHNTQPWKFALKENAIEIHPDYARSLPVVDPDHRELWISLGSALENLLVAARASGYAPEVTYPEKSEFIQVRLAPDAPQGGALFDAIPLRQNTRSEYDGQPVRTADLDQLQALPLEPGVALRFISQPAEMETTLDYVSQGNLNQYADMAFIDELIAWLRFNKKEAMAIAGRPVFASARATRKSRTGWAGCLLAGTKPQQQADADAKKLRSSPGAVLVASEADDKSTWVRTGQVYERLALKMTALNIKSAFLNQPIELASLRSQFQTAMGMGTTLPQLLVRFGYAATLPRSLRRPVEQVII